LCDGCRRDDRGCWQQGWSRRWSTCRGLSFDAGEIEYLRRLPILSGVGENFFDYLRDFRFRGEVWAVREGTPVFAGEPILRVTAPLIEAQIAETVSSLNDQLSDPDCDQGGTDRGGSGGPIDRRVRGPAVSRIWGGDAGGTGGIHWRMCGNFERWKRDIGTGCRIYGTAAHSFTQAFDEEIEAFRAFFRLFGDQTTLLLDTYDTIRAANLATEFGKRLRGVRIDSGDLGDSRGR
jgi:nicotinate phosphoribosyltransferase